MTFVTAWLAVAGVAAMAVPVLIHLLMRRRREPVPWAAMRLLRQALREQSRRLRLEQLLVLALRCLILLAVGAAVAQPLRRGGGFLEGSSGRTVFLVVDDGLISGVRDERGTTALQRQVAVAETILASLEPGDSVGLIAAARPARGLVLPASSSPTSVESMLRTLAPADAATDIPGAISMLREAIDRVPEDRPVAAFLLSEFRQGSGDLASALEPLLADRASPGGRPLELIAAPAAETSIDNVQVVAVEPLRRLLLPGQSDGSGQVTVRLRRFGSLPEGTSQVRLSGPGLRGEQVRQVRWEEGRSETSAEILLESDESTERSEAAARSAVGLEVRTDADALPTDDRRVAVLQARRAVQVALLDRRAFASTSGFDRLVAGQWLARALRPSEGAPIELVIEDPTRVDARALRGVDAAVVARPDLLDASGWEALVDLLGRGGMVVLVPPGDQRVHGWLDRMANHLQVSWRAELEAVDPAVPIPPAEVQPTSALLRLLESELSELLSAVRVFRRIPVDASMAGGDLVVVAADGSPLILAANPRLASTPRQDGTGSVALGVAPGVAAVDAAVDAAARTDEALPGLLVLFTFAPELGWTDLPLRPAMVPLIQEIVRQGVGLSGRSSEVLVGERVWTGPAAVELVRRGGAALGAGRDLGDGEGGGAPVQVRAGRSAALTEAGLYRVMDTAGQESGLVAVNVEPHAGDPTPQSPEAVMAWLRGSGPWRQLDLADPGAPLKQVESSSTLSGILLAIALLAALLECWLARRFSHATVRFSDDEAVGPGGPTAGQRTGSRLGSAAVRPTEEVPA